MIYVVILEQRTVHSLHVQNGLNAQRLVSRCLKTSSKHTVAKYCMGGSQVSTLLLVSFCSQPGVELSVLLVSPPLTETSRGSACRGMSVSLKGQLNRN